MKVTLENRWGLTVGARNIGIIVDPVGTALEVPAQPREEAHAPLEQLSTCQFDALYTLLEVLVEPPKLPPRF